MIVKTNLKLIEIIKDIYTRSRDDDVPALAAQLTYYFILALFPFLIFLITLLSYTPITGEEAMNFFARILPPLAFNAVLDVVNEITASPRETFLSFGMIAALWASSNGMKAVIRGINKAYDQKETRPFWMVRLISLVAVIILAFTVIFSLALLLFGETAEKELFYHFRFPNIYRGVCTTVRFLLPVILMFCVFILLYMLTPSRRLSLKEVLPGSAFSALSWILVTTLFSLYINNFADFSKMYGSIGGIIALLVWLYWISIIIMLGGELNASLAQKKE
ncbi:MAG TPA: YihY/virulence factor BrkB family protein [Hungateiclostridium thermocellum]|uniref:Ribonuclease BN n=2 Tax=Acetivibrio thermocellus TaxID=1515 RepID=A3DHF7_ACET2|nr:YihY/virulence factor BrkB family protein [Acetivibrio thermocellus]ABN53386.1 ribonuclease BN [Acetivibrio thermocellus ATCC 27405]ADU75828.1 ribonuclease BN [Acetivibrio thermocellus DSM 1313]ALX09860.1 ribonuclease BN [Acetivibrio thermocellus AD2]ANV77634.1 ribonuclease BN [Acetivibrio thermocellus DSM 2360]CDG36702.1 putative ribonuclease BN [Acetivibrio thermocellus BC1]